MNNGIVAIPMIIIGIILFWALYMSAYPENKIKVNIRFLWFDFWMGLFYDRNRKILYFCPLPMVVFSFWIEKMRICPECKKWMSKEAYLDYDAWDLSYVCKESNCLEVIPIEWTFGDSWMNATKLEEMGYEIM